MDIITYFGDFLAECLGVDAQVVRGLIRLVLHEKIGEKYQPLTYNLLRETFDKDLRMKMRLVIGEGTDEIIDKLLEELRQNRELLTLLRV